MSATDPLALRTKTRARCGRRASENAREAGSSFGNPSDWAVHVAGSRSPYPCVGFVSGSTGLLVNWRRRADFAGSLIAFGPLQQRLEREDRVVDALVEVAELGEPIRHRRYGAVVGLDVVDLVPADRRRDGRVRCAADGVRAQAIVWSRAFWL